MRRGLLSEATEGLQQPKFRRGKSSSLILEDSGDYQQTLREKYTGQKSHAFRRSLVNARRMQSGYASSDSDSDSDSAFESDKGIRNKNDLGNLGNPGPVISSGLGVGVGGVHLPQGQSQGQGQGALGQDTGTGSDTGSETEGVSPAVSPVAVAVASSSVQSSLSSRFASKANLQRQFSQDNPVFNTKSMGLMNEIGAIGKMTLHNNNNNNNNNNGFQSSLYKGKNQAQHHPHPHPHQHKAKRAEQQHHYLNHPNLSSSPRTPSLKAAILEEEELMLTEEKDKNKHNYSSSHLQSGDRKALHDLRSGSDPISTSTTPSSTGLGAGRKLFGDPSDPSDPSGHHHNHTNISSNSNSREEETVLARARLKPHSGKDSLDDQSERGGRPGPAGGGRPGGNGNLLRSSSFDLHALIRDRKLESFLQPCSSREMVKCRMTRKRGLVGSYPVFEMHLDIQGMPEEKSFLLCARKRKKSKSSYYIISLQRDGLTRESEGYIAKLRGNLLGSEYTLYRRAGDKGDQGQLEGGDELMVIKYKQTLLTKEGGPREMTSIFTDPASSSHYNANRDLLKHYRQSKEAFKSKLEHSNSNPQQVSSTHEENSLTASLTSGGRRHENLHASAHANANANALPPLVVLRSVEPQWRDDLQCYVLDFKGRVTEASVKNFVMEKSTLVKPKDKKNGASARGARGGSGASGGQGTGEGEGEVGANTHARRRLNRTREVVIFGKRGKNEFALDVASPCSILQAFALAIASTDFKMVNSM